MPYVADRFHRHVHGTALICEILFYSAAFFQLGLAIFPRSPISAMTPCVEVVLSWALSGCEVQRWRVPMDSFLEDVVTEDLLNSLPGEVDVLHGQKRLQRPLHVEVRQCMESSENCLLLGLVRTHALKDEDCDLVPYLCLDGVNAVRIKELSVRFTFAKNEPERFSHAFKAMAKQFKDEAETSIRRQVFDLMKRALPGCVLRRKMELFVSDIDGDDSPLTMSCVLVLSTNGELKLRMELRPFAMLDDDEAAAAEVRAAVNEIYHTTFQTPP